MIFAGFRDTVAIINNRHALLNVELHFSHDVERSYVDQQKEPSGENH
jgi:hypothetical protein